VKTRDRRERRASLERETRGETGTETRRKRRAMRRIEEGSRRGPVPGATMVKTNGGSGTTGTVGVGRVTGGQEVDQDRMSQDHAVNRFHRARSRGAATS
jgi:hypothetical protein